MKPDKAASLLGLAMKAGRLKSGEFLTEKAVKSMTAALVIVASDASDNTKKSFANMCEYYEVPMKIWGTKESIGAAIGREMRASLALTDEGLAAAFLKQLRPEQENEADGGKK